MMNTFKKNILYDKTNPYRNKRLSSLIEKKSDLSSTDDLSSEMNHLSNYINNICHQSYVTLDEIFKSSNSNSTLGKFYQLFLLLKDNKNHLLNKNVFDNLIIKNPESLITKLNQIHKHSMNFIQFIQQIDLISKENHISKEYLYKKLLHQTFFINNENKNNNALDISIISHNLLLNEYNKDLSYLKHYFITHCEKSKNNSNHQMTCSNFIKCICQDTKLNKINIHLELNALFYQIQSLLVNQGVYIPGSFTIDFHGFILCLQQIARTFHFNLRILIKNLINKK